MNEDAKTASAAHPSGPDMSVLLSEAFSADSDTDPTGGRLPSDPGSPESVTDPTIRSATGFHNASPSLLSAMLDATPCPSQGPAFTSIDWRFVGASPIAEGGMAGISEAFDSLLLRNVALRTLLSDEKNDGRLIRFIAEARITAQIDHPGVVPVYDLSLDDDRLRLVMKLVRGMTLTRLFEELHDRRLEQSDLRRVARLLIQICETISFAHSRGVIHRDLKPDNVMVGEHGELYVMDWGVALVRPCGDERRRHVRSVAEAAGNNRVGIAGTVAFMAPEQARGTIADITEQTDVYGAGGILYYFLTGCPPHMGPTPAAALRLAQSGWVPPIGQYAIWSNYPPELARIAMKALAPEPADRYPNMAALRADLEQFLDGGGWFATRKFLPGQAIITEGEMAESAYILVEGECGVYKNIAGAETLLRNLGPGDVFGETAVVTGRPRSATVLALTTVTVKVVTRESLERELETNRWMGAFVRALAERFLELDDLRQPDDPPTERI